MYYGIAHNEKGHFTSQEKGTFLKLEGGGGGLTLTRFLQPCTSSCTNYKQALQTVVKVLFYFILFVLYYNCRNTSIIGLFDGIDATLDDRV